jgi:hypothetical protein
MEQLLGDVLNDNDSFLDEDEPSVASSEPGDVASPILKVLNVTKKWVAYNPVL